MMKRKMRGLALLLSVLLAFQSFGFVAFAATDLKGHWSEVKMNDWINKGFIKGYPDGTVKPNNKITRAEFMAIVNKAFEYSGGYSASFSDVAKTDWYYSVIAVAIANGYIGGYPDGKMKPKAPISRAEAAAIIAKVANLTADYSTASYYNDKASIPSWALGAVGAVTKAGIMSGYSGGVFGPNRPITRAETVMALSKALELKSIGSQVYDVPGNYGSASMPQTIKGDVSIKTANVNLRNMLITGSLMIDKSVGNGNVTLTNVQVQGQIFVNGGGSNSVVFDGVTSPTLYAGRKDGMVRIVATGATRIDNVVVQEDTKLEETALSSNGFIAVRMDSGSGIDLELVGAKLDSVTIKASSSTMNLDSKTVVDRVMVTGTSNVLKTVSGAVLSYLIADADVTVKGAGTITKADVNVSGVSFDVKPATLNVKSGVSAPTILGSAIDSWAPSSGATSVAIASDIVIKFNKKVRLKSQNTDLTNTNVDEGSLITVKTKNSSGTKVNFNASVTTISGKTILTIDPSSDLLYDQIYYVAVDGDMLEDYDDNGLVGALSSTFTTIVDGAPAVSSFSPSNGSTNVLVGSSVIIALSERVRMINANTDLTNSNVDNAIILRKNNVNGDNVAFDATVATVSGKTVITVKPTSSLLNNQSYYVAISDDVLEDYADLRIIGTKAATFTTITTNAVPVVDVFSPVAGATNVPVAGNVTVTFNKDLRLSDNSTLTTTNVLERVKLYETGLSGAVVPYTATIGNTSGKMVLTIDPTATLKSGQVYYLVITGLEDYLDQAMGASSLTFTTVTNSVTGVVVTGGGLAISAPGGTLQMLADVQPATATDKSVTWTVTSGTGTATINAAGLLTAVSNGTVTVKATSVNNAAAFGQAVVTLSNQLTVTVAGAGNLTAITSPNGTLQMTAEVLPANAPDKGVVWSVANGTGTATISSTGLLTAGSNGTVTVKASSSINGAIFGQQVITISNQAVTGVIVSGVGGVSSVVVGATLQMSAQVQPTGWPNQNVVWSVIPDTGAAAIDVNGLLTAVSVGTVRVKANSVSNPAVVGELIVTVSAPTVAVETVTISGLETTISSSGGAVVLMADVLPSNATNKTLVWSIESGSDYATLDANGGLTATLTAKGNGEVVVKAASVNGIVGRITITITGQ